MQVRVAGLALILALALAACGEDQSGGAETARYLDPRSDAVLALDLDYDGGNWQQIERLYAKAIESDALDDDGYVPPTLDGALGAAAAFAGISFEDELKPLLGGTLHLGIRVAPAEPLSPAARSLLERLDDDATRVTPHSVQYFDRDGRRLETDAVEAALMEDGRGPEVTGTIVYRVGDPDALERVIEKLRGQGLREQPVPGIEDAMYLTDGVAVVGGDTIVVAVGSDGPDDRLLRERLAQEEGAQAPESDGAFIPARAAPALLGAVLDREELVRALATDAGSALRDDFDLQLLRALVARAEASASARDGDIEADAELLWARP